MRLSGYLFLSVLSCGKSQSPADERPLVVAARECQDADAASLQRVTSMLASSCTPDAIASSLLSARLQPRASARVKVPRPPSSAPLRRTVNLTRAGYRFALFSDAQGTPRDAHSGFLGTLILDFCPMTCGKAGCRPPPPPRPSSRPSRAPTAVPAEPVGTDTSPSAHPSQAHFRERIG